MDYQVLGGSLHSGAEDKKSGSAAAAQVNVNSMLNQQHQQYPAPVANQPVAQTQQSASNSGPSKSKAKASPAQEAARPAATQQKLAKAVSEYLSKDTANKGKQCSSDSLMLLLRNNPTYPDVCAQWETRGFALNRQDMARFLLAAVPALLSNNNGQEQKKAEASKNTPPSYATPSLSSPDYGATSTTFTICTICTNCTSSIITTPRHPRHNRLNQFNNLHHPKLQHQHYLKASRPRASTGTAGSSEQKKEKKSLQRPRKSDGAWISNTPVGPKAEVAKKRLFSEIVDMFQMSSDDEDGFSRSTTNMNLNLAQRPSFPDPGPDVMDLGTDSPHPAEQNVTDSRAEMAEPEIEFDPDDEFVLREIKLYYNPQSIARDVMLATGRHPSERPLNFHLMHLIQTFTGFTLRSDLETVKWDLVDPGGPSMPVVELEDIFLEPPQLTRKRRRRRRRDASRDDPDAKGPTSDSRPQPSQTTAALGQQLLPSVSTPDGARDSMAGTPTTNQRNGRRGRPPGAKNKKPPKAALTDLAETATGPSTRNVQTSVSAPASSVPEPSYPMFTCEWASCPAQLHDVHTLERHVVRNHVSGQTTCQWQNCPNYTTECSGEGLMKHLLKVHIRPLAWKYGDRPSVNGTDYNIDRYLITNGLHVTPDATTASESDALIFPVGPTPIRAFNRLYGNQKPTDRARQVLRAVQKRRKRVGIGLEQGGCEFSTPVRNKLFVNDEEFYEVVTDDEEGTDNWFSQDVSS
ncbi:C2H2 finger domain protein, putative [Talaromyces stipitatus ATCC 10500]|uniref:C2H2 finger domain protein, putative n=1 Tax=Talaromyces stipitatus (strain ATCC 10500 / CBS 375.48 / QM 6759 / NRRL 1006) TaxID=441959 RepID=B8MES0_TALSN|nr:C2H2 finger domain protein, putative [Talaromyces stipitatus ATCC 10500]EED16953.1 C2H2 finger domain protein, putative [Talaromyces stipitatus ATCC 10500]